MKIAWASLFVLACITQIAIAATRYVDASPHTPVSPYTSWATAATNIQDAINSAGGGETILVTDGVYQTGGVSSPINTRIDSLGKFPTIQSVNGPAVTIIRGFTNSSSSPMLRCAYLTSGTVLSGFTLTGGGDITRGGGGVCCETADCIVTNCIIAGNIDSSSSYGAGAHGGTLVNCLLTNNISGTGGGAASSILINCTLVANRGFTGAGVYGGSLTNCLLVANVCNGNGGGAANATLEHCTVSNNVATGTGTGGGVYFCKVNDSLISSNQSVGSYGGGAYFSTLSNCIVRNNFSGNYGGGAYGGALTNCLIVSNSTVSYGQGGGAANAALNQCLVTGNAANYGAGLASCVGNNCTIVGNLAIGSGYGAGAYNGQLNNSIIYYNQAATNADTYHAVLTNCCTPSLAYPLIASSFTNEPAFVDPSGDFHLQSGSPCINAGNNSFMVNTNDFDGNPRIVGGTVDVGAYEFQTPSSILSYVWLLQYGLPADGSADYRDDDGDGMNNWQEWIAGTNPTNGASCLRMDSATPANDASGVNVSWQSVSGKNYILQRSTDLSVFSNIQSNINGQAGTTSYKDGGAVGNGSFFYRVTVQ